MNDYSLIMAPVFMRLLVTYCINFSMRVNSLRDSQCESVLFFPFFYDTLILFTSGFFIVASFLEEVGPWKKNIFFFWMTFMVPIGFGPDLSCLADTDLSGTLEKMSLAFLFLSCTHPSPHQGKGVSIPLSCSFL